LVPSLPAEPLQEIGQAQEHYKFLGGIDGKIPAKMAAVAEQELVPDGRDAIRIAHLVRREKDKHIRATCCDRP